MSASCRPAPGALAGDDSLTCEQIYAQGAAVSQREQEERGRKSAEMRQQAEAAAAATTGASLLGAMPGAGRAAAMAANHAAERYAERTVAEASAAPPPNVRKERLRQLWTDKHCAHDPAPAAGAADAHGARPGDDSLTCEQIGAELAPYAQQMTPNVPALAQLQQQQFERSRQMKEQRTKENEILSPLASLGAQDPTGLLKRAYGRAAAAQGAKERGEDRAEAESPLARQAQAGRESLVGQGQQLQADGRVQRLLALAQSKGCGK